jgi:hypothetical protein
MPLRNNELQTLALLGYNEPGRPAGMRKGLWGDQAQKGGTIIRLQRRTGRENELFIVSENDHVVDRTLAMTRLHESSPEPKTFKTFAGSAHGTELFDTEHGDEFRETLLNFLEGIRSPR